MDKVLLVDAIIVEWSWLTSDRHKVDGGLKHIDGGSMFTKLIGKAKELWFLSYYDILFYVLTNDKTNLLKYFD